MSLVDKSGGMTNSKSKMKFNPHFLVVEAYVVLDFLVHRGLSGCKDEVVEC